MSNKKNNKTRILRHYLPVKDKVIAETIGRAEVWTSGEPKPATTSKNPVPHEAFDALNGCPSFDDADVEVAWKPSRHVHWPKTTASGLSLEPAAWQLCCYCRRHSCWEKLKLAWMSTVPPKGSLIRRKGADAETSLILSLIHI